MFASLNNRLQRARMRRKVKKAVGLKRVSILVPDTRSRKFAEFCRRQAEKAAESDQKDDDLSSWMDSAVADHDQWK